MLYSAEATSYVKQNKRTKYRPAKNCVAKMVQKAFLSPIFCNATVQHFFKIIEQSAIGDIFANLFHLLVFTIRRQKDKISSVYIIGLFEVHFM